MFLRFHSCSIKKDDKSSEIKNLYCLIATVCTSVSVPRAGKSTTFMYFSKVQVTRGGKAAQVEVN